MLSLPPKAAAPAPTSTLSKQVTPDATCGGTNNYTCQGSSFGNCCSSAGWCGSTSDYCDAGCQSAFGTCASDPLPVSTGTSAAPPAPTALPVSDSGTCAGTAGTTCQGSAFGDCCSQYGWCGATDGHCGEGCQAGFGTCG